METKECCNSKKCIISYNSKVLSVKDVIKILYTIVKIFKKIILLIDEIQTLILKFNDDVFNYHENIPSVKKALIDANEILYTNIQMLFNTTESNSINILSHSSDLLPIPGLIINYANTQVYINSYRMTYSKDGIIKLVEYDNNLKPVSINWIGTHLNKITEQTYNYRLSRCFNNNLKTINYIKLKCLHYIQLINNLQKIIK